MCGRRRRLSVCDDRGPNRQPSTVSSTVKPYLVLLLALTGTIPYLALLPLLVVVVLEEALINPAETVVPVEAVTEMAVLAVLVILRP